MAIRLRSRLRAGSSLYTTAALSLDFLSGTLDPRITFTRATTATFVGSNGLIQTAAINGPRFDYDPVTLAAKGLLIEEQRTNLLTYSEQFDNAVWSKVNSSVTANATASPSGTTTADLLIANTSNTQHRLDYITTSTAATHAFSVYAKAGGYNFISLRLGSNGGYVNLSNGAVSGVTAGYTATATDVGNGWYRIVLVGSAALNDTARINVCQSATTDFAGDGTSGIYLWGAQLEAGAFATSYIPTVASTVTRSADVATMVGANFSNWYNQNEGSFVIAVDSATTGYRTNLQVDDGTLNNRILIQTNNVATAQQYYVVVGGSAVVNTAAQPYSSAGSKTSATYKLNDYAYSVNGTAVTTDTSATVPAVNRMFLGTEVSSNFLNGHIRSISYYNTRLRNDELQVITG